MNSTLALFAILAIIGLAQAHQFPDFGKGPLHEDIQDILDLVPAQDISNVVLTYLAEDTEVKEAFEYLVSSSILKDLMVEFEAISEVINFFNFLHEEGIDIYFLINRINKNLGIKELEPPSDAQSTMIIGGIAGLFKDIKILFHYDDYIRIYVQKMKTSSAFVRFVNQLKSDNFQEIVNKLYESDSFQIILNFLKSEEVNTRIVADIMFIVLGITVPDHTDYVHFIRTVNTRVPYHIASRQSSSRI
ncbi:protein G12-like [Anoplolepis gracilipes]|uniref:protein G12-like n=1 Tax=Anoplolepis gracilipes TaxID=354296 RepID=UPI003BA0B031